MQWVACDSTFIAQAWPCFGSNVCLSSFIDGKCFEKQCLYQVSSHAVLLAAISPLLKRCLADTVLLDSDAVVLVPNLSVDDISVLFNYICGKDR